MWAWLLSWVSSFTKPPKLRCLESIKDGSFCREVFTLRIECACVNLFQFSRFSICSVDCFPTLFTDGDHNSLVMPARCSNMCQSLYALTHNIHQPQPIIAFTGEIMHANLIGTIETYKMNGSDHLMKPCWSHFVSYEMEGCMRDQHTKGSLSTKYKQINRATSHYFDWPICPSAHTLLSLSTRDGITCGHMGSRPRVVSGFFFFWNFRW